MCKEVKSFLRPFPKRRQIYGFFAKGKGKTFAIFAPAKNLSDEKMYSFVTHYC